MGDGRDHRIGDEHGVAQGEKETEGNMPHPRHTICLQLVCGPCPHRRCGQDGHLFGVGKTDGSGLCSCDGGAVRADAVCLRALLRRRKTSAEEISRNGGRIGAEHCVQRVRLL